MDPSPERWQRSSYCAHADCVEVAFLDSRVAVRDSKDQQGPVLLFTASEWDAFLEGARQGEFDLGRR